MGKLRKRLMYLTIPVVLVLILEGLIYYSASGFTTLQVIMCTLENAVMSFVARPTINSFYAFRSINENYTFFDRVITNLYGLTIIIAPILTTSVVLTGFQSYVLDFLYSLKITSKEKLFVIGDGRVAGTIARKYADRYFVQYLMPSTTDSKARLPYLKKKIWAYAVDYDSMPAVLKDTKMEKASCVVLNFRNWFENLQPINEIIDHLVKYNTVEKPVTLYIVDAPKLYRDVFRNVFHGLYLKYGKPEDALEVKFLNISEINTRNFFKNPDLTEQPENRHHFVLLGLGRYGIALFTELTRYMDRNGLWGTIDVFDRNIEKNISDVMFSDGIIENPDRIEDADPPENAKASGCIQTDAGPIRVNYYQASVGELDFTLYLTKALEKDQLTEMFFCIDDPSVNFECYRLIVSLCDPKENVRFYFRTKNSISKYTDAVEMSSPAFRHLPDGLPEVDLFEETFDRVTPSAGGDVPSPPKSANRDTPS